MARGYAIAIGYDIAAGGATGMPGARAESDAAAYAELFSGSGYRVDRFIGDAASRWAVLARLHELSRLASSGDVVAVAFSGAGGRHWSHEGVETFWLCRDGRLTHTDLQRAWSWFNAGVRVLIINDSCYSIFSEWDREWFSDKASYRARARHDGDAAVLSMTGAAVSVTADITASVLCLTACSCVDSDSDRCTGGLFTEALLRTWNRGAFRGDYNTFCKRIRQALCGLQTPELVTIGPQAREFELQRPFAINPPARKASS